MNATKFTLEIDLGNDAMTDRADIAAALERVARRIRNNVGAGIIKDENGNTVGKFGFEFEEENEHMAVCANCRIAVPFGDDGQPLPHTDTRTGRSCG